MSPLEIIIIVVATSFVIFIFSREIYKKIKYGSESSCQCCKSKMNKMLKKARKKLKQI